VIQRIGQPLTVLAPTGAPLSKVPSLPAAATAAHTRAPAVDAAPHAARAARAGLHRPRSPAP